MNSSVFYPKLLVVLKKGYNRQFFKGDAFAGIIVGIVALPLSIAFAIASGVSPERGIITAVIAGFIVSLLGGSRVQISGPTGAFIIIVVSVLQKYGFDGLVISTIIAGIMLILFGTLRLGAIITYLPYPLIVGFSSGIAIIIITSQVKDIFGLNIENAPLGFISRWREYFHCINSINVYALAISLCSILVTIYFKKITTKIPGSFVAIILSAALVAVFKLPVTTIESVYGEIPNHISFHMPDIQWLQLGNYIEPAFTIAILGAIEALLSAVVSDGMISSNHRSNTELIAQGVANIITPLFGGIPATGAVVRTATNVKNGGRTPIAGMIHSVMLLLILIFLVKWTKYIPLSCLAGILVVVAYNMSEIRSFASILRSSRYDVLILITVFFLTILVNLTIALEIGMVMSAMLFMERMSKMSEISALEDNEDLTEDYQVLPKGMSVYEINGPFFFAAARKYKKTLMDFDRSTKVLILRMRNVPFIDSTGTHHFKSVVKQLKNKKIKVILSGVKPEVSEELRKSRILFMVGKANVFDNFPDAVKHAYNWLLEADSRQVNKKSNTYF